MKSCNPTFHFCVRLCLHRRPNRCLISCDAHVACFTSFLCTVTCALQPSSHQMDRHSACCRSAACLLHHFPAHTCSSLLCTFPLPTFLACMSHRPRVTTIHSTKAHNTTPATSSTATHPRLKPLPAVVPMLCDPSSFCPLSNRGWPTADSRSPNTGSAGLQASRAWPVCYKGRSSPGARKRYRRSFVMPRRQGQKIAEVTSRPKMWQTLAYGHTKVWQTSSLIS